MIMNKNERPSFLRGRGAAVGLVICFVAVIAIAGAYTFNNYKKQMNEQVAKAGGPGRRPYRRSRARRRQRTISIC